MLLLHLHKDQDVVQVYYYDPFSYDGSEDVVHHGLKGSGTIGYSKEHYEQFEQATVGVESRLPFISGLDAYIIEAPTDVKFCEVLGSAELRDEFGDERERVSIFDGYGIQHAIVLDQLEQTIFLLNKEHWGCDRGFGGSDSSSAEVFLQEDVQLHLFQWGQGVDFRQLRLCSGY